MASITKNSEMKFFELEKDIMKLGLRYMLNIMEVDFLFPVNNRSDEFNSITIFIRDSKQVLDFYREEKLQRVYSYGSFKVNAFDEWKRLDDYLLLPTNKFLMDFYCEMLELIHDSYDFLLNNKRNFSIRLSSWDLRLATNRIRSIQDEFTLWLKKRFRELEINFYSYPLYDLEVLFDTRSLYNHSLSEGHLFEIQEKFNELVDYSKDQKLQRYYQISFKHKEEPDYHARKYY